MGEIDRGLKHIKGCWNSITIVTYLYSKDIDIC